MQDCSISIANAMEILQSCTKPLLLYQYLSVSMMFLERFCLLYMACLSGSQPTRYMTPPSLHHTGGWMVPQECWPVIPIENHLKHVEISWVSFLHNGNSKIVKTTSVFHQEETRISYDYLIFMMEILKLTLIKSPFILRTKRLKKMLQLIR